MAVFFDARINEGAAITIIWDGQLLDTSVWAIAKDTPRLEQAKQFIRFATRPQNMAKLASHIPYGPTRRSAMRRIGLHATSNVPMLHHMPTSKANLRRAIRMDSIWYARTKALRQRRFKACYPRQQGTDMNDIIVLWATPRSTSTAFEWMMRMRGDMACFHEPFGEAWYQGDEALWSRLSPDSPRTPGLTFASVLARMKDAAANKKVFSKDMPQFTDHLWSSEFLGHFRHSFLIRHPAKVLTSVHRNWPEFDRREIGFDVQRRLFDRLADETGEPPPLIDSDDLLEDPHGLVEVYCNAVGVPFIADALSWEPGERREVLWYDTDSVWHENLKNSDGLKPQPRKDADISKTPDWVQDIYADFLPHYEHMRAHRLTKRCGQGDPSAKA